MKKSRPKCWNAGHAPMNSVIATPSNRIRTSDADPNVMKRKPASRSFSLPSAALRSLGRLPEVSVAGIADAVIARLACPQILLDRGRYDPRTGTAAKPPPRAG
jgi:hypothetical protein